MFDFLVPKAFAQGVAGNNTGTAATTENVQTGLQKFFGYVLSHLNSWLAGAVVIAIFYVLAKMASQAIVKAITREREDVQQSTLLLFERITKITILGIGVTIALAINGLNFTAVIGALSLGIGFALKDIVANFISSIILLSQDRIKIGDLINVNGIIGTIISIDTRISVLQALDGTEVVVPNAVMLSSTLISYTTNPFRRIDLMLGVGYETDLSLAISLIKGVFDKCKEVVVKPEPLITVDEFVNGTIQICARFWVESRAPGGWQRIRSDIAYRIKRAFDKVGISMPSGVTTIKLDEDDRAILKTIDSIRKGYVPEPHKNPTKEQVAEAALETENLPKHPYKIFPEPQKPAPTPPVAPVPVVVPVTPPAPPKPPAPPPTHM